MSAVAAILQIDLKRFLRDRLMLVFSAVVLVLYVVVISVVPDDIQPEWAFATTEEGAELVEAALTNLAEGEEIPLTRFPDEAALRAAFSPDDGEEEEGEETAAGAGEAALDEERAEASYFLGFALPPGAMEAVRRGERPTVRIYVDESMPPENQAMAEMIAEQVVLASFGLAPDFEPAPAEEDVFLGPKVEARSFKEQMRSMLALVILMMEMLALGSLLSREIKSGTVHALLTTTVSLPAYFTAKLLFGASLAFSQAWIVSAATGALAGAPLLLTAYLVFGALMFTGFGLMTGAKGRDLMEVLIWGMLVMLPSLIPAVTAVLPGSDPLWIQVIPTYPLIRGMITAGDAAPLVAPSVHLAWAAGWAAVVVAGGLWVLRRRLK